MNKGGVKKIVICEYERTLYEDILERTHLPGHIEMNALYEQVSRNHVGITQKMIKTFISSCVNYQRETVPRPFVSLTPIVPSFVHGRLIAETKIFRNTLPRTTRCDTCLLLLSTLSQNLHLFIVV
ncbi:hypothetical protein CDIK_0266 [Cucumispora dikerogammari]|nr:hypothetical protein CDIK_0266 [Cucumispora dikerogammari]